MARFWSAFDAYIVDGIVNGVAALTRFVAWFNGLFDTYIIDGLVNGLCRCHVTGWAIDSAGYRPATSTVISTASSSPWR